MIIPMEHFLIFGIILFTIGVYGTLVRRNLIGVLISIELILNSVNLNLVVFSRTTALDPITGQIFAVFIIAIAAAAVAVGLAIVISLYRVRKTVLTDDVNLLKW